MAARSTVSEVFIDGEKVVFEGTPPATLGGMQTLLERALADAGRVLTSLTVDDRDASGEPPDLRLGATAKVAATSIPVIVARRRMAADAAAALVEARAGLEALAGGVLRAPWDETVGACIRAAEILGRVLQGASTAAGAARADDPVRTSVEELGRALEFWMDAVQARDAAGVSLRIDVAVQPTLARLEAALALMLREEASA